MRPRRSRQGQARSYDAGGAVRQERDQQVLGRLCRSDHVWMRDVGKSLATFQDSFKDWTDRYKFAAEVKHATMQINPARMVCTSQYMPEEIPGLDEATLEAMDRRFQFITIGEDGIARRHPRVNVVDVAVPIIVDVMEPRPRAAPRPL